MAALTEIGQSKARLVPFQGECKRRSRCVSIWSDPLRLASEGALVAAWALAVARNGTTRYSCMARAFWVGPGSRHQAGGQSPQDSGAEEIR